MSKPLLFILLILLVSLSQSIYYTLDGSRLISESYAPSSNYDASEIVSSKTINQDMLNFYTWFASYGYCEHEQIPLSCCKSHTEFFTEKWTIIDESSISDYYNYNYVVWRNDEYKKFIFSFPGTRHDIMELLSEAINSKLVNYYEIDNGIKVVNYFYKVVKAIKSLVYSTKTLEDIKNHPGYQIIFVGHSLGASVAAIMLYTGFVENHINNNYNPALITYGMPRTGNEDWVIDFNYRIKNVLRVVRDGDIVTSVPYGLINNPYRHIGGLILVNKDVNSMYYCPKDIGEDYPDKECERDKSVDAKYHNNYFNPEVYLSHRCDRDTLMN